MIPKKEGRLTRKEGRKATKEGRREGYQGRIPRKEGRKEGYQGWKEGGKGINEGRKEGRIPRKIRRKYTVVWDAADAAAADAAAGEGCASWPCFFAALLVLQEGRTEEGVRWRKRKKKRKNERTKEEMKERKNERKAGRNLQPRVALRLQLDTGPFKLEKVDEGVDPATLAHDALAGARVGAEDVHQRSARALRHALLRKVLPPHMTEAERDVPLLPEGKEGP